MSPTRYSTRKRALALVAGATAALLSVGVLPPAANAAATLPAPDGLSAATAAASCWEVKVNKPSSPSGIYWLYTPALKVPEQFYCDQTTDGGGWVLIGRGLKDWSESNEGQGTPAEVRDTITGTAAFAPRQLSSTLIGALLNGTAVSSLPDGVRLRRALNTSGTSFQEGRLKYATPRVDWTWLFNSRQEAGTWQFGDARGSGGVFDNASGIGSGTGVNSLQLKTGKAQGWLVGFGYGSSAAGSTSASSFIYKSGTEYARPFTQVYLRPKLLSKDILTPLPDGGTPASAQPNLASSFASTTVWGVNGLGAAGSGIQNTEVSAFAEANGVVYVGGNFLNVQRDAAGTGKVQQSYLAAFSVDTGEWISSFRPTFDNQVKALAVLPDGRLAVGGEFSTVNGAAKNGLVVLNAGGDIDPVFTGRLINAASSSAGKARVRSLDVQDGWLYVGGAFTHVTGGSYTSQTYSRSAARLSVGNGTPDKTWTTEFDGTVISLDAAARGDRVYFAGYFANNKAQPTLRAAALTADTGAVVPWKVAFSEPTASYQQAVKEIGDRVWIGGSQHMFFSYNRNSMAELSTNITISGGDFQAIANDGDVIYAGCHCYQGNYSGARTWPTPTGWSRASRIDATGAWSAADGSYLADFSPNFSTREGAGTWALLTDSTGKTWMGGDFTGARKSSTVAQWVGGFARFPRNDSSAPAAPSNLQAAATDTQVALSWTGSNDDSGSVTYQVLRDDRVVAVTTATSAMLPPAPADARYFVRAADKAGNVSASTTAVRASAPTPPSPDSTATLIATGDTWSYRYSSVAPPADWTASGFDASTWPIGSAPLGWGDASIKTTLTAPSPKPLASYFRKAFTITDASTIASVTLSTRADDGIVVYVNGVEVNRTRMPAGTVGLGTYATAPIRTTQALASPVSITVPGSAFVSGTNVITAEVHSNYKATPDTSFDLTATASTQPAGTPPPAGGGTTPPPGGGTTSPPAAGTPLPAGTVVVADGATWSYYHEAAAPASTWRDTAFDATAWKTGPAPLGWGSASIKTPITSPTTPRPLATYYRSSFTIPTGSIPAGGLTLTTRADDGIIVFVNGTEVGRANLPTGTITHTSYALTAPNTTNATANPITFTVPASALAEGANVISVQVQSNYKATRDSSFDLNAAVK